MAKKPRNRTTDYATYLAVRALVAALQTVTPRVAYAIADAFAWLVYTFVKSRRRVALENVRAAFPELVADPGAADRIVRGMFRHLMIVVVELLWLPRKLHIGNWRKHLAVPAGDRMIPPMLDGRAMLAVTAHFGNWEMVGCALGLFGFRTYAIARVLDNAYLERYVLRFRQYTGQAIIPKKGTGAFNWLTEVLRAGGKVAALADQDAGPGGVFVDFFGRPASTHKAIALMAMAHDAVILVTGTPRVRRADYPQRPDYDPHSPLAPMFYAVKVADVIDPREYASDPNAVKAITARYTAGLERLIREHPEQYFWLHRRWKHQPVAKKAKTQAA
jgi:Kdo2-lipid IVA lauroyltransferase/acyltransferase